LTNFCYYKINTVREVGIQEGDFVIETVIYVRNVVCILPRCNNYDNIITYYSSTLVNNIDTLLK